ATGGAATAMINLTGANHVVATGNARGGAGAGSDDVGGDATATADATATSSDATNGVANATAHASGGGGIAGTASATAQATTAAGQQAQAVSVLDGSGGQQQATATSSHGSIVTSLSSQAQAPFTVSNGQVQADTNAVNPYGFAGGDNAAYAAGTIDPNASFVSTIFGANANIAAASAPGAISGLGASFSAVFGAATEGMFVPNGTSGSHTFTSTEDFTLNSGIISGHLIVGLAGTSVTGNAGDGSDFSNLTFTVAVNGATTASGSFTSLSAAQAFFSNNAVDAGGFDSSQPLDVKVILSVTSATANFGFADQFVVGSTDGVAPPVAAAPATVLIQQGQAGAISGVSVSEATALTGGQTVTVALTDTSGLLSQTAGQGTVGGNASTDLTLTGTVAQVNADLATLSDTDATAGSDTITVTSSDGRTGVGTPVTIAVTVHGIPVIAVPGPQTIGVGTAATIGGVSVSEAGATGSPETFSAAVSDTSGVLSATGFSAAGASITITGASLSDLNADLASLTDTNATPGSDTIIVSASDSFGAAAANQSIAVTTNGLPAIAVPGSQTIGVDTAATIGGVMVSETGNTGSPETFSVAVSDTNGVLSATGFSAAGTSITITGVSLSDLNQDLASLTDTNATAGGDTITVSATDSFGAAAANQTIAVTTNGAPAVAVPGAQTIGIGTAATIGGVVVSETGNTGWPETFSATLSDANGVLSATGFSAAGTSITVSGVSLNTLNDELTSLSDTDGMAGSDTITVNATDRFGNAATAKTVAVTVNDLPAVAVPGSQTLGVGVAATIGGVVVSETGNTGSPETFSATVSDAAGVLSATGFSAAGTSITVSGVSLNTLNTDLANLTDTNATAGSDTITVSANDSFGNAAAAKTVAVTVNAAPVIAVPGAKTIAIGNAAAIGGVGVSETGNTAAPETYSATLSDANGVLSATGFSAAGTSITLSGVSLNTLNTDLASLSDTDGVAGSDTITVHATDSFGNAATAKTVAVTVNGAPAIAAPANVTIADVQPNAISGVSLSESGSTTGETFTATLTDTSGLLSATGTGVSGSGSASLTITSSIAVVNAALVTLKDTEAATGADTIKLGATDSFGAAAANKTIAVTTTSNIHWTSQISGNFPVGNDWTPHVTPGATDAAILDAPGSTAYIVIAGASETVASVQTASTARLAITGGVFTITGGTGSGSNAGQVSVTQNGTLDIGGVFANSREIFVENSGAIQVAAGGLTLTGRGSVYLADNTLEGATTGATLTTSNFIYGAGQLGAGQMTLVNQAAGVIESYGSSLFTINTGANSITNAGAFLALGAGGMTIASAVANTGHFAVNGGSMTVMGAVTGSGYAEVVSGTLDFAGAFNENVIFTSGSTGTLELAHSIGYTGRIQGLSTTGANALDLADITFTSGVTTATFSGSTTSGVLTVTDGTHTARIGLIGNYAGHTFTTSLGAGGV
ncbi:MAG TPA: hypothetical protein VFC47_13625, partial [Caulobacteraceae bacterium]|nr:hypothetical protein [Caulobacteraceae bacterium]